MTKVAVIPIQTPSVANKREHHHARARRTKTHRIAVAMVLRPPYPSLPVVVTLTRVAPRLLDTDNLGMALKAVRDQVAICLGVTDGPRDERVRWAYDQRQASTHAVEVRIEPRGAA